MRKLIVIHPHEGGPNQLALPYPGDEPGIELLQALVGGYVEPFTCVWEGTTRTMYTNEDGKRLQLPLNRIATRLLHPRYGGQPVVGVIAIDVPK